MLLRFRTFTVPGELAGSSAVQYLFGRRARPNNLGAAGRALEIKMLFHYAAG